MNWLNSKKGFIASYIADFYAYLIFVAIVILFFVIMAFMSPPAEGKEIQTKKLNTDATTILIQALKTPLIINSQQTTPVQIIQNNEEEHAKEFKEAIAKTLLTAYPSKRNTEDFWLSVYQKNSVPQILCRAQPTTTFSYGHRGNEQSARSAIYAIVHIPTKNKIDAMTVLLCIGGYYFQ